jgi:hypothetical protein
MRWLTSPASRLGAGFRRRGQQGLPVRVIAENRLAAVAAIPPRMHRQIIFGTLPDTRRRKPLSKKALGLI